MDHPLYRFEFATGGDGWSREFFLVSDEAAAVEGRMLLENQAVTRPGSEMRLTVSRVVDGQPQALGTWVWADKAASWHPPGEASA